MTDFLQGQKPSLIERAIPTLTALSLLATPVFVAWIGYRSTAVSTSKDYVSLAVSILNAKDSPAASRQWAVNVLDEMSPVNVPDDMKRDLYTGRQPLLISAPCIERIPERPKPLVQPIPAEGREALDLALAKLSEWAGYGERVEATMTPCVM